MLLVSILASMCISNISLGKLITLLGSVFLHENGNNDILGRSVELMDQMIGFW